MKRLSLLLLGLLLLQEAALAETLEFVTYYPSTGGGGGGGGAASRRLDVDNGTVGPNYSANTINGLSDADLNAIGTGFLLLENGIGVGLTNPITTFSTTKNVQLQLTGNLVLPPTDLDGNNEPVGIIYSAAEGTDIAVAPALLHTFGDNNLFLA